MNLFRIFTMALFLITIQSCDEWKSSGDCGFVDEEMVQIYLITNGIDGEDDDSHDT